MSQEFNLQTEEDLKTLKSDYSDAFPTSVSEMSANYFSRAMLMPKNLFIDRVAEYTNSNGNCNVFELAKYFRVEYSDAIARGRDLNIWNLKVGI